VQTRSPPISTARARTSTHSPRRGASRSTTTARRWSPAARSWTSGYAAEADGGR